MKCPHCNENFHVHWDETLLGAHGAGKYWYQRNTTCPGCHRDTIEIQRVNNYGLITDAWLRVHPQNSARSPAPAEVPLNIAEDYNEAGLILALSPKASAALARRVLQAILRSNGFQAGSLAQEVEKFINDQGTPSAVRDTVDAIRNFGNFSAHPITDVTSLQIIPVDEHEAGWCLEIIDELFDHFYVKPAQAAKRKLALNAKLSAAGKPPAK